MTADNGYFMYYDKKFIFSADDVKSLDKMMSVAASSGKKFAMDLIRGGTCIHFLVIQDLIYQLILMA